MAGKITEKNLRARVNVLNRLLNYPIEVNNYHYYVGRGDGGYRLEQLHTESGGVRELSSISLNALWSTPSDQEIYWVSIRSPRGTKREVYDYVSAMIDGIIETHNAYRKAVRKMEKCAV